MKILFITANRLGDAVMTTGVLGWLIDQYPEAQLTIACGPYAADLFHPVPRLERLLILRKQSWNRHWLTLWRECRKTRWDLIVDLRDSLVTRLLPADKKLYPNRSVGMHKVKENGLVVEPDGKVTPAPRLWTDLRAEKEAAHLVPAGANVIALGPAANWPPKQWPIERFIELASKLTAADGPLPNAHIMVIAGANERAGVMPLLESIPPDKRIEVIGFDLITCLACAKKARLFVGNDSGLAHLAAAAGTPTLSLFGPSDEKIYGPWGPRCNSVRTPESMDKLMGKLSSGSEQNLMTGLTVKKVFEAALRLLGK